MKKGFSLVELLLVLGLISLVAAMAYPNYKHLLVRTRRLEAQTSLLNLANRIEQDGTQTLSQAKRLTRWYELKIQETKNKRYVLTARPISSQGTQDTQCQALTLTSEGIEGIAEGPQGQPTGWVEQCWS
ncbi:MAG: type IV pilin protein [Legionellaceae bacterium]|nr:type IV pilin protein [Legionellaceae bacterium]